MNPLETVTLTINAVDASGNPGVQSSDFGGVFFMVKQATADFKLRFDAGTPFDSGANWKYSDPSSPFSRFTIYNYNPFQLIVTVYVGQVGVDYMGPNVTIDAPTIPRGNLGIAGAGDIAKVFGSKVATVAVTNNGSNTYIVGDILTTPDGTGHAAKFQVLALPGSGSRIHPITHLAFGIIDPGNYSVQPATPCNLLGGTGNGAIATLTFAASIAGMLAFSGGWLTITNAAPLVIPNGPGNNARKSISIKVKSTSAGGLLVQDANGCTVRDLAIGEEKPFNTSGVLQIIADSGNLCTFTTEEEYYL
jgi:hypothetical protein